MQRGMKILVMMLGLLVAPSLAAADDLAPPSQPQTQDARLVPVMQDGKFVGIKVYAIRQGGRFAAAAFQNGDTILTIDGEPVTTDAGKQALNDKVIRGTADATVVVKRRGNQVTLTSKRS